MADLRCSQCDYQLKGLPWWHRCPECGTPIRLSVAHRRRRLREGPPQHTAILLWVAIAYAAINVAAGVFARSDALPTFIVLNPLLVGLAAIAAQHVNSPRPFHWRAVGGLLLFLLAAGVISALAAR